MYFEGRGNRIPDNFVGAIMETEESRRTPSLP